jgi:hypothetical protein
MKMIEAIVDMETGEVSIETSGYKGVGCHAVQEAFSKALGGDVIEEKRKPEYNAKVTKTKCVTR